MNKDADNLLPLRPVAYQVLLALADGERHGYGIVRDISQRTAARMSLEPGNLYRTLKWMLGQQLIEESDRRPAADLDDERRRYYRITRFGWRVGVAETSRLEELVAEAKTKRWSPR
jgi:DNA-binding PadR family transcriptional regulator